MDTKFKKGEVANPKGRPKGSKGKYTQKQLFEALERDRDDHDGQSMLDYFIVQARKDNHVLIAFMRKVLPDCKQVEVSVSDENDKWATTSPSDIVKEMDDLTVGIKNGDN